MKEAVPFIAKYNDHGCHAFVDASFAPIRAWPDFYVEASRTADVHIILCTGFYRELELGTYWAKKQEWQTWPFVRSSSVEELTEYCIREIAEGIHGTDVHAGAIKLGASGAVLTEAEVKCFRAGARAQRATGVHITTHCTSKDGAFAQLELLDREGVNLNRVAIGHIGWSLDDPAFRARALEWMKRGASILPTNLGIVDGGVKKDGSVQYQGLVEAIHRIFDAGCGDRLGFGMDWCFGTDGREVGGCDGKGRFGPCNYVPPPPFIHLFTDALPHFRKLGLRADEEEVIMRVMPQRIIPVQ
jgi:predicted metal-dependent phosphotriesterase family hydrolase